MARYEGDTSEKRGYQEQTAKDIIEDTQRKAGAMVQEEAARFNDYARQKKERAEVMIRKHPLLFVVGAFLGGAILGSLMSKRH